MHNLPPPPLSVHETADYLGVSERVVRRLLRMQQLDGLKVAGAWRISRAGLQDYVVRQLSKARAHGKTSP
jgi:excisionase family DNA binding protein